MEKIIKRTDGTKVKVIMSYVGGYTGNVRVSVSICEKGKRTFKPVIDTDDYEYRKLGIHERIEYTKKETLKHVSIAELDEIKDEFISKLDYTFS